MSEPVGEINQPVAANPLTPNVAGMQIAGEGIERMSSHVTCWVPPAPVMTAMGAVIVEDAVGALLA